jgi:hypothetical protein
MGLRLNNYIKTFSILFIGIFSISFSVPSYGFEHNEKISIKHNIEGVAFSAGIDYRFYGDDIFRRHYDMGAGFPLKFLGDGWSGGVNYRLVYKESNDEESWDLEKRPHAHIKKSFKTSEFKWQIRSRQEFRISETGDYTTRNRIRIRVKSDREVFKVKPFFSNEFFYDFDVGKYNKNRINMGVDLPEFYETKSSLYCKLTTDFDDDETAHTPSLVFKVAF